MRVIYTAGPYRSPQGVWGMTQNIARATVIARELWLAGWAVICPHANTAHMDGTDTDHVFLDGDLEILRRCDAVVMLPGWEQSAGSRGERELAVSLGLPIYEWPRDAEELRKT